MPGAGSAVGSRQVPSQPGPSELPLFQSRILGRSSPPCLRAWRERSVVVAAKLDPVPVGVPGVDRHTGSPGPEDLGGTLLDCQAPSLEHLLPIGCWHDQAEVVQVGTFSLGPLALDEVDDRRRVDAHGGEGDLAAVPRLYPFPRQTQRAHVPSQGSFLVLGDEDDMVEPGDPHAPIISRTTTDEVISLGRFWGMSRFAHPVAPDDERVVDRGLALADRLLEASQGAASPIGRRREDRFRRILASERGPRTIFALADRGLRPPEPRAGLQQLARLSLGEVGALGSVDRFLAGVAVNVGRLLPGPVMAMVRARVRYETLPLIFPAEPARLGRALRRVRAAKGLPNLNLLGEAILGESEAERRTRAVGELLLRPDVDCVSVKVSSLASGLSLVDEAGSVTRISERLRQLYRIALRREPASMVVLDMEEHRDLHLTVETLHAVMQDTEFDGLELGIALQAYLPDTHAVVEDLLSWARQRAGRGGGGLYVRLVKGANLAMERVEAEIHGWSVAPYVTKAETDASYLRLLDRLLQEGHGSWLRVGIGTHNLFFLSYGLALAEARGMGERVRPEMLAGMAGRQAVATARMAGQVLLYVPITTDRDFHTSIAYLARRLDENATPGGFLRHAFEFAVGSDAWREQRTQFLAALGAREGVSTTPHQRQDRTRLPEAVASGLARESGPEPVHRVGQGFTNEPDTDLSVAANREWARQALAKTERSSVAGASLEDVERAVSRAATATWKTTTTAERRRALGVAAEVMAAGRQRAIAVMAGETGKTFEEADSEVSEAIDYARWYAGQTHLFDELSSEATMEPLGTVAVVPPWNFPYAIPAGGVLAALAAGNSVILKPSPEARGVSSLLVDQLHEAGIPRDVLQLVPTPDDEAGRRLVTHEAIAAVVMTGSWDTAQRFAAWRADLHLLAETSGKNAILVSATADVDQAVRDIVHSAFSHAGQKCSAASLAIVHASIHDRSAFLRQLADAIRSLRVGAANDPASQVGPIVGPFTDDLERALTRLDPGESWLVEPRCIDQDARLWSPGLRVGVAPGSWAHMTEWFGPVLGIMRAPNFQTALTWQNAVPYGLTAGLQSLDRDEQEAWIEAVQSGNVYVNRPTTGAIVGRQPFGGWKRSAFGPTAKTGGPNYLLTLGRWSDVGPSTARQAQGSYGAWWEGYFSGRHDIAGLRSEENVLVYRPLSGVILRVGSDVEPDQVARALSAARVVGAPVEVSSSVPLEIGGAAAVVEEVEALIERLGDGRRLRVLGPPEQSLLSAASALGVTVSTDMVSACGRVELPRWLREKLVSRSRHRYGSLIE